MKSPTHKILRDQRIKAKANVCINLYRRLSCVNLNIRYNL